MYIPDGFNTVTPYLFMQQADELVDFLLGAFDGKEMGRHLRADGKIANAQVRIGTTTLMISESTQEYPPTPGSFYLYVENADAAMRQALTQGAEVEMEVDDMPYGDRQGGVKDPFGNIWWISQRLVQEPYF